MGQNNKGGNAIGMLAPVAGAAANTIFGLATAGINNRMQLRQQERLNEQQLEFNRRQGEMNLQQQLALWEKTGCDPPE